MKKTKIIVLVLMIVFCQIIFTFQIKNIKYRVDSVYNHQYYDERVESRTKNQPTISTCRNIDYIEAIFDRKLSDFELYGYFPQIYEPSLQATYYGLYILDTLGNLGEVNKTAITKLILYKNLLLEKIYDFCQSNKFLNMYLVLLLEYFMSMLVKL